MMKPILDNDERPFSERRRQQFMNEAFYAEAARYFRDGLTRFAERMKLAELDAEDRSLLSASSADFEYQLLSLRYTAGNPIEPLRGELEKVVAANERHAQYLRAYENEPIFPPFRFREIADYERCLQLIGLCYLLHRRDLLPRIAALQDPNYYGHDAVYEELLDYELPERYDTEELFYLKPYEHLIDAMYADSDPASIQALERYCEAWYPAMAEAPWHDGHKRIQGTEGDYFGYWAFEAGALVYLLELDDSSIDHLVYPKDLVAWARANKHLSEEPSDVIPHGRCEAGQPCPRSGFWFTPAQAGSRRFFKVGEVMPSVDGDYGATIWQWDRNQDEPQL